MGLWNRGIRAATPLIFVLALGMAGCEQHRSVVFVVDTSGSMKKDGLIGEVKASMNKILQEYGPGDRVYLVGFDAETRVILDQVLQTPEDRNRISEVVDSIRADGKWTDLVGALDTSLGRVAEVRERDPGARTLVVLYTDGRHDPPKDKRTAQVSRFEDLIAKYYQGYKAGESWFIFYVELAESDPGLRSFLKKTGSGVVVGREALRRAEGFARLPEVNWKTPVLTGLAVLLVLLIWTLLIAPRLRGVSLVPLDDRFGRGPGRDRIRLDSFRSGTLMRLLGLGAPSEIQLTMGGSRLDVQVDAKGKYFVRPLKGQSLKLDGMTVHEVKEVRLGQKLEVGKTEYVLQRNKRKES